jgi:xanthine dehydrogenase accessory factor
VEKLLDKPLKYLGLIGSETKWRRFQKRLLDKGLSSKALQAVICPIGLPIGGKTPAEVAISFAAEIVQIQNNHLKNFTLSQPHRQNESEDLWMEDLT